MRRLALAGLLSALLLLPAGAVAAEECAQLTGVGRLDFGRTGFGVLRLNLDGERLNVVFVGTGFVDTGENTADIFFDVFFPEGIVSMVEHSTNTPLTPPLVGFDSTIDVLAGGSGQWTWSGTANLQKGRANIQQLSGTLCTG